MRPGINENVMLTSYGFEKLSETSTKPPVLTFTFSNNSGGTFKWRFWDLNIDAIRKNAESGKMVHKVDNAVKGYVKGNQITPDQAVQMASDDMARKAKHLLTKFMTEEESELKAVSTYKEFGDAICAKLAGRTESVSLRLKLVYDQNDYLSIPRYKNFLELMSVNPTKLTIDPKDVVTRSSSPSSNEEVSAATSTGVESDLPF
jgi:hypothetical protein